MVDSIPIPNDDNDEYKRFQLFNYTRDSLKLNGFSIVNDKGESFRLSDTEIRPHGYLYIALNKAKRKTDIVAPSTFKFNFGPNEKLYLADNHGQKVEIFPMKHIHHSLADFKQSPLKATPFGDEDTQIRGVIIENVTGRTTTLVNMTLTNERRTFKKAIPNQELKVETKLRLVCTKNDNQYLPQLSKNDLFIKNSQVNHDEDQLLIVDIYGNEFELYRYGDNQQNHNHNHNHNRNDKDIDYQMNDSTNCFVM